MIVITGAAGYIGSHLARRLVLDGKSVRALVHNRKRAEEEGRLAGLPVEWVEADVIRPESLQKAFAGASAVIHTVAIAIEKGKRSYEQINYQGTVNAVEAAKGTGVRRFVNMSQLGADSRLPYRFLASKGKAQDYVAASGLDWTAFRPSVVWGPEDEFANTFARLVPLTPLIFPIVGDENARFQPVWVEDVATSFALALDDESTIGKEFELGGPEVLTLEEIERRTLRAIGARRWMIRFPMPLLRVVVSLMEKLLPNPPVTRSLLELLAVSNVTEENAIHRFVPDPRPFKEETIAPYMREFRVRETLASYFGR
jgi:NADH dehydrogenase